MKWLYALLMIMLFSVGVTAQESQISFVENKGQWEPQVKYRADIYQGQIFMRKNGLTMVKHHPDDMQRSEISLHGHVHQAADENGYVVADVNRSAKPGDGYTIRSHAWNIDFVGAAANATITADKPGEGYNNYFIGKDSSRWATHCRTFYGITMKNVYPNVDVRYYTHEGTLKYDIIVYPGADVSKIKLRYDGVDGLRLKKNELVVKTSVGEMVEGAPYTYQSTRQGRKEVKSSYLVNGNEVRFSIKDYDPKQILVIDPRVIYCSYAGSNSDAWGYTATYDRRGATYGGGIVFGTRGGGFPVSPGAFQTSFQGGASLGDGPTDIGIIKLSSNGTTREYATYIGGSGNEQPHSLVADAQGNLIILGRTSDKSSYPATGNFYGPEGSTGYDIVVTKLNTTGTAIMASRVIGGSGDDGVNIQAARNGQNSLVKSYGDEGRSEVIVDEAGNIYVASMTKSTNFFTRSAFQGASGGQQDGVVIKFNRDLEVIVSSYLGGGGNDAAYTLDLNTNNGHLYVAGGTASSNFPGTKTGTVGEANNGAIDGFIAEIDNTSHVLVRTTYIGTDKDDQVYGLKFDREGNLYIAGQTFGQWNIVNAPFNNGNSGQFIAKLPPDLSAYTYSTTFGSGRGRPDISITAMAVDKCENVYVSGWGGSIGGTGGGYALGYLRGMPVAGEIVSPMRSTSNDAGDFYFFVLEKNATRALYGAYFGQVGMQFADHVDGGTSRFDPEGIIYQTMCACGTERHPTTIGAWRANKSGNVNCDIAMMKIRFDFLGVSGFVQAMIEDEPVYEEDCIPVNTPITFTDLIRNAQEYIWDFGDGSPVVGPVPGAAEGHTQQHSYTQPGDYRVMMIAIDLTSCNERDTVYTSVRVRDNLATLNALAVKVGECEELDYRFDNLSTALNGTFNATAFIWDFGDGSSRVTAGLNDQVLHTYASPGTYNAKLILNDDSFCNYPQEFDFVVRVAVNVRAGFQTPSAGCAPYAAVFENTSQGGLSFAWDFGDGTTSADAVPTHTYTVPGTYTVTLTVTDPNTCNITDITTQTITVSSSPVAGFMFSPTIPVENMPLEFTNLSSPDAVRFVWNFGDGDTLATTSREMIKHQFNLTGEFTVCLTAYNQLNCSDTYCLPVQTLVAPLVDVPNAFTPNRPGENSVVKVRGYGIAKMRFTIYNRWGQKVFETENRNEGWNGMYKGVLQPMDVYAYTLEVDFFDETRVTKTGDITLIR